MFGGYPFSVRRGSYRSIATLQKYKFYVTIGGKSCRIVVRPAQSRFGDKIHELGLLCSPNGTVVLKFRVSVTVLIHTRSAGGRYVLRLGFGLVGSISVRSCSFEK